MSVKKLHVLLVNPSLLQGRGGLQRSGANLANGLAWRGHQVSVMARGLPGSLPAFPLEKNVRLLPVTLLDLPEQRAALREQVVELDPDVCVIMFSWQDMLWWPVLLQRTGIPLLISERSNPETIENELWNRADRLTAMSGADIIHLLCRSYADSLPPWLWERVRIIPNGCAMPSVLKKMENGSGKIVLAVGRLDDATKCFSHAIRAFAALSDAFPDWRLEIWGDGPDRDTLDGLIHTLGLEGRALLGGMAEDIAAVYARADIFCHPSRFEGFPNAVIEAMRHSLPVVGYSFCPGLNEIVRHGENGMLADGEEELASSLRTLMCDAVARQHMAFAAHATGECYGLEPVLDQWEIVLEEAAARKGRTELLLPVDQEPLVMLRRRLDALLSLPRLHGKNPRHPRLSLKDYPVPDMTSEELVMPDDAEGRDEKQIFSIVDDASVALITMQVLENSGLFDRDWYRLTYLKGRAELLDPLEHYVRLGADKGYNPNAWFNTTSYRDTHMGVHEAGVNPLLHYVLYQEKNISILGKGSPCA